MLNRRVRPALDRRTVGWLHRPIHIDPMQEAMNQLMGEHDFSAFRASQCQAKSPIRTLHEASVERHGDYVIFHFCANAFLHHMVRNIVGALVYIGQGKHPPDWIVELLVARDRKQAAPTFPAAGLYLSGIQYDSRWGVPVTNPSPFFMD